MIFRIAEEVAGLIKVSFILSVTNSLLDKIFYVFTFLRYKLQQKINSFTSCIISDVIIQCFLESAAQRCSAKQGVLKNFTKFIEKHCFIKPFIKKENLAQVFSSEFCEIFKNTFLYRTPPLVASVFNNSLITRPKLK